MTCGVVSWASPSTPCTAARSGTGCAAYGASTGYIEGIDPADSWPEETAEHAARGFIATKFRIGRYPIKHEMAILERIAADHPTMTLMADGNAAYDISRVHPGRSRPRRAGLPLAGGADAPAWRVRGVRAGRGGAGHRARRRRDHPEPPRGAGHDAPRLLRHLPAGAGHHRRHRRGDLGRRAGPAARIGLRAPHVGQHHRHRGRAPRAGHGARTRRPRPRP